MKAFDVFQEVAIVDVENIKRRIRGEDRSVVSSVDVEMATSVAS